MYNKNEKVYIIKYRFIPFHKTNKNKNFKLAFNKKIYIFILNYNYITYIIRIISDQSQFFLAADSINNKFFVCKN